MKNFINVVNKTVDSIKDIFLNFDFNMISFTIQRVTGIALSFYLILHLFVLSRAIVSADTYNSFMLTFENPIIFAMEIVLVMGIAFHLLNGIRVIIVDFLPLTRHQAKMAWMTFLLCLLIFLVTVYLEMPKFIEFYRSEIIEVLL